MSFEWLDYLDLAKELYKSSTKSPSESKLRSAISRAYYAAFHTVKSYLEEKDPHLLISQDGKAHIEVINAFKYDSNPKRVQIGEGLNRLKVARTKADYQKKEVNAKQAESCIEEVGTLIRRLKFLQ